MNGKRSVYISALTYTGISALASTLFLGATFAWGDYTRVARAGGAGWVFLLSMIILMPTITPWVKKRLDQPRDGRQGNKPKEAAMSVQESGSSAKGTAATDPVCGMSVDPATTRWSSDHQGTKYYFCAKGCKESFDKKPADYIK
ncbi:MAG: YHS domain-containing protein [Dietzia sp.]|uniref:YHS domain-containing protein n=1 Tax=Dietzia sp. TaxID=1871616 RepID=UPI002717D59B|nr:YHS domain-containing protein [Dietzia sp.]MDO8394440.1 YHS domain-containing protein [Dietzia sp.]